MKRVVFIPSSPGHSGPDDGPKHAIDKLINKYKGQEGVTVVNIGPELFQID